MRYGPIVGAGSRLLSPDSYDLLLLWQRLGASSIIRCNRTRSVEGKPITIIVATKLFLDCIVVVVRTSIREQIEAAIIYLTICVVVDRKFR